MEHGTGELPDIQGPVIVAKKAEILEAFRLRLRMEIPSPDEPEGFRALYASFEVMKALPEEERESFAAFYGSARLNCELSRGR
jgi:hypothetical protein